MDGEDSELTEQDRRTLKTLARAIRNSEVDRRDLLKMGLGGAMGAGATHLLTGGAMADASTSDSDGDWGTPSSPMDGYASAIEFQDEASDPSSNGNVQRNGTDIKAFSGGSVRNLSNIGSGGGTSLWTEDGNSPQTETATASSTYTLSGTYDFVMVFMDVEEVAGTNSVVDLRVNGDTGSNYSYRNSDGTLTSGTTQIDKFGFVAANFNTQYQFLFSGRWNGNWNGGRVETGPGNEAIGMANGNITSPLDSFTVLDSDSENIDVAFEVYGRDIASAGEP